VAEIDSAGLRPELPDAFEVLGGLAVDAGRPAGGLRLLIAAGALHQEVTQLVTEGLSNPDIASRLCISRATVKTHLAHIFTKLDVSNRTQLAAVTTRTDSEGIR